MKIINFYIENWANDGINDGYTPLPNGVFDFKFKQSFAENNFTGVIDEIRDSELQSSLNEIFLKAQYGQQRYAIAFEHKDLKIVLTEISCVKSNFLFKITIGIILFIIKITHFTLFFL